MARKVLISFIGTGNPNNGTGNKREYRTAQYEYNGKEIKSAFIASALGEMLGIDTYYLFGTMKSIWEAVYLHFAEWKNIKHDDNYAFKLYENAESANHTTPIEAEIFTDLENLIGNDSKIEPIFYGLDKSEIQKNFKIFVDTLQGLKDGDVLYLDITHSFRSLPLFATTAISFIQDVTDKKIKLGGIYYGMMEATGEFKGLTPIIDLSYISNLQSWIKGAYAFTQFGNGNLISELLQDYNKNASQKIKEFSDILALNYISDIKSQIATLKTIAKESEYQLPEKLVVPKVFNEFIDFFKNARALSDYQFILSRWHEKNNNWALAYLCFVESLISFTCEQNGFNEKNEVERTKAKGEIMQHDYAGLKSLFDKSNSIRKEIAHAIEKDNTFHRSSVSEAVKQLKVFQKKFQKIKNNAH